MQKSRKRAIPQKDTAEETESVNSDNDDSAEEEPTIGIGAGAGNAGWADSIAKVLNTAKPKTKKTLVLSRAKKIKAENTKLKAKAPGFDFEVEGVAATLVDDTQSEKEQRDLKRKNVALALRVKPSWQDLERERTLRKVATRGVVQLFNAVRIEQKDLQQQLDEAGPLDSRKDAVLNNINKRKFLDVLMSGRRAKSETVDNLVKSEKTKKEDSSETEVSSDEDATGGTAKKSEWNVLKPDYMTNKKLKHWDEEDEETDGSDDDEDADNDDNK